VRAGSHVALRFRLPLRRRLLAYVDYLWLRLPPTIAILQLALTATMFPPIDPLRRSGASERVGVPTRLEATIAGGSVFNDGIGLPLSRLASVSC